MLWQYYNSLEVLMEEELAADVCSSAQPEEGCEDSRAEDAGWCTGLLSPLLLKILYFLHI